MQIVQFATLRGIKAKPSENIEQKKSLQQGKSIQKSMYCVVRTPNFFCLVTHLFLKYQL